MVHQGKCIRECRQDLQILKELWDVIATVLYQLEAWQSVTFTAIKTDDMEDQVQRYPPESQPASGLAGHEPVTIATPLVPQPELFLLELRNFDTWLFFPRSLVPQCLRVPNH